VVGLEEFYEEKVEGGESKGGKGEEGKIGRTPLP